MAHPFFTVAIPVKNRPQRLVNAIRSVLAQTFDDFELIVCDNSDETHVADTRAVVAGFDDARLRYVRTNGRLSMPDNWEHALRDARGEYIGVLTDRSVYTRNTLAIAHDVVQQTGGQVLCWLADHFGKDAAGRQFQRRVCSLRNYEHESATLLDYFLHGHPKYATKIVPKLMSGMFHRDVVNAARRSALGRICPPVAPDYTSGYLALGHSTSVVLVDRALFILCGSGNGSAFRRRGALADRFRADLGMTWEDLVDRMPSDACFAHALILNDFMRIKAALPEQYARFEFDPLPYYLGCLLDYTRTARLGADRTEDFDALVASLNAEPIELQRAVRGRQLYLAAILPSLRVAQGSDDELDERHDSRYPEFDSVFDAMLWAEENPVACEESAMPMPGLELIKPWRLGKQSSPAEVVA